MMITVASYAAIAGMHRPIDTDPDDKLRIFLDGEEQHYVYVADNEQGFVRRYCRNERGELIVDDDQLRTEEVKGVVRFEKPTWWPAHNGMPL